MENTNPKLFTNIRVFAGDKSKQAADASYRNLFWENFHVNHSFNIGTKVQRNKEIGTIDSWGPLFRVSFDLIIHKFRHDTEWSSLLSFRGNGATCDWCKIGDRVPALFLNNEFGRIQFSNNGENINDYFFFTIEPNHWYNINIEQKSINRKVIKLKRKSSSIDISIIRHFILFQLMGN